MHSHHALRKAAQLSRINALRHCQPFGLFSNVVWQDLGFHGETQSLLCQQQSFVVGAAIYTPGAENETTRCETQASLPVRCSQGQSPEKDKWDAIKKHA